MRILLLCCADSVHVLNFIRIALSGIPGAEITIAHVGKNPMNCPELSEYCAKNGVNLMQSTASGQMMPQKLHKILRVRRRVYPRLLAARLRAQGRFDCCLIHFVSENSCRTALAASGSIGRIIPVFWGSDLMRGELIGSGLFRRLFDRADRIILNTENMQRVFHASAGECYREKERVIKFPVDSFEIMDKLAAEETPQQRRAAAGLPQDRLIVVCGHNATGADRHTEIIERLSGCRAELIRRCFFVFPMSYGDGDIAGYQREVKSALDKSPLEGAVITEFAPRRESLRLYSCSDIFITAITTDAFGAVMQENLYGGAAVIYGKWLNYFELEHGDIKVFPYDTMEALPAVFEQTAEILPSVRQELCKNAAVIRDISSPERIAQRWRDEILTEN